MAKRIAEQLKDAIQAHIDTGNTTVTIEELKDWKLKAKKIDARRAYDGSKTNRRKSSKK